MSSTFEQITSLLDATRLVNEKHRLEAQLTGIDFNIFSITKMETKEVNTHSAMIAELLNPQGRHHQGDVFLRLFIDNVLGLTGIDPPDYAKASVIAEHYIGELGRIDIVIRLPQHLIVIENKINAADQKNQLVRYSEWMAKQVQTERHLYYLSKYGGEASELSHGGKTKYTPISYQTDITYWLELALKEVAMVPMVSGAILQYLSLVKKITGNMGNNKKMELIKLLLSNEAHLEAAMDISSVIQSPEALSELQMQFWKNLKKGLEKRLASNDVETVVTLSDGLDESVEKCMRRKRTKGSPGPQFFGLCVQVDGVEPLLIRVEKTTECVHIGFALNGVNIFVTQDHVDAYERDYPGRIEQLLHLPGWGWGYNEEAKASEGYICHRRMQNGDLRFHNQFAETYRDQKLYKQEGIDDCVTEVMLLIEELKLLCPDVIKPTSF